MKIGLLVLLEVVKKNKTMSLRAIARQTRSYVSDHAWLRVCFVANAPGTTLSNDIVLNSFKGFRLDKASKPYSFNLAPSI